jgi:hypothetical protein
VNFRSKRHVMVLIGVLAVVGMAGGAFAAYLSRHDKICPDGRPPIAQRSEVIGQTEYKCPGGVVVTK